MILIKVVWGSYQSLSLDTKIVNKVVVHHSCSQSNHISDLITVLKSRLKMMIIKRRYKMKRSLMKIELAQAVVGIALMIHASSLLVERIRIVIVTVIQFKRV